MYKSFLFIISSLWLVAALSACGDDKKNGDAVDTEADEDGDGLPDYWELEHFGNLDQGPDDDPDGDGRTNLEEFMEGTDPNKKDSGNTDGDTDTDTDTDADGDADGNCADIAWSVETRPINLMVLLDRSLSMQSNTIGDATYAQVVAEAIEQLVSSNVSSGLIDFGLSVFPSPECPSVVNGQPDGLTLEQQCSPADALYDQPMVSFGTAEVHDAFLDVLGSVGQCGGTPICDSLNWLGAYLGELDSPNDTYVLLATDGAPNCAFATSIPADCVNTTSDPLFSSTQCLDDRCSYNAASKLSAAGYKTFVIGVGEEVQDYVDVMDAIAYYGAGGTNPVAEIPPPTATTNWFYPAGNASELNDALVKITNSAISCEYTVEWGTVPDVIPGTNQDVIKSCSDINVLGVPVDDQAANVTMAYMADCSAEKDGKYGWYWAQMEGQSFDEVKKDKENLAGCTTLKLCPAACDMVKVIEGKRQWKSVTAQFGCATQVIDIN